MTMTFAPLGIRPQDLCDVGSPLPKPPRRGIFTGIIEAIKRCLRAERRADPARIKAAGDLAFMAALDITGTLPLMFD